MEDLDRFGGSRIGGSDLGGSNLGGSGLEGSDLGGSGPGGSDLGDSGPGGSGPGGSGLGGSALGSNHSGRAVPGRTDGVTGIPSTRQDIDMTHYRLLLMEKKSQVEHGIKSIKDNTFSEGQKWNVGESSSYDQHIAEQGLETFERGKDLGLKEGLETHQFKVAKALERMDNGTYGYCQNCKQPLASGRLEVMPDAELCVSCQEHQEALPAIRRPVEEQTINTYMRGTETLTDEPYAVGREERDKAHQGKNAKRLT